MDAEVAENYAKSYAAGAILMPSPLELAHAGDETLRMRVV